MNGCNGRMGRVISDIAKDYDCEIVAGIDVTSSTDRNFPTFTNISQCDVTADVIIDFSHPKAFSDVTSYAVRKRLPLVFCTTGLTDEQLSELEIIAEKIPVFKSANMSLGINILIELAKKAAKFLEGNFDIEIVERHHNQKLDAPSGTALMIADEINTALSAPCDYAYDRSQKREKRNKTEIGIHAVRGGTIVGDHSIIFAGYDEVIELNHSAASRDVFASGAVKAAKFLIGKNPGFYQMSNMIEDNIPLV